MNTIDGVRPSTAGLVAVGIGLVGGLGSGLFGIGGGLIMVPAMVSLLHRGQHEAHAIILGVAAIAGARVGSRVMASLSNRALRLVFCVAASLIALRLAFGVEPSA